VHLEDGFFIGGQAVGDLRRQGEMHHVAAAAFGQAFARPVHDHGTHDARCIGEEGTPILGVQFACVDEAQVGFVDQCRGVELGMAPVDALRTAWARTADQKLTCAVMGLLFALILLVGFVALVIGLIPAMMVAVLLQAAAYRQLAGRSAAA